METIFIQLGKKYGQNPPSYFWISPLWMIFIIDHLCLQVTKSALGICATFLIKWQFDLLLSKIF